MKTAIDSNGIKRIAQNVMKGKGKGVGDNTGIADVDPKAQALAEFLGIDVGEVTQVSYDSNVYEGNGEKWLILSEQEADSTVRERIKDDLWTFNPEFLVNYTDLDDPEILKIILEHKYEDASPIFLKLVGDRFEDLVEDAIAADGTGHFLSAYDGNEEDFGDFYGYRQN